ncbi:MAG: porin [Nitrospirota bacterium]
MKFAKIGLGIISIGLLTVQVAMADGPKVSGFLDTTFNARIGESKSKMTNFGRKFDKPANTFLLNTAHFHIHAESGKAVSHVELDFGNDQPASASEMIQKAYIKVKGGAGALTAGKFGALHGIEVANAGQNPTISRGYLYIYAKPASLTGVKVEHKLGKMVNFTLGAANGWGVDVDTNRKKALLGGIGFNFGKPLSLGLAYYDLKGDPGSIGDKEMLDVTGVSQWGPVAVNFQYNEGTQDNNATVESKWSGYALEPVYSFGENFSIGARYEWFKDKDGVSGFKSGIPVAVGQEAYNLTLAPTWKFSSAPVTLRAELRKDRWKNASGGTAMESDTVSTELIYAF